jgi:hypothetical protein
VRVSHTQLEAFRSNPKGWLAAAQAKTRASFGFNSAVKFAIAHYHKSSSHKSAQDKLEDYLANFSDVGRKQWARDTLDNYVVWYLGTELFVADTMPRLSLDVAPELTISGELNRVDMEPISGDYHAILLTPVSIPAWKDELRWPLLQVAVAERYQRNQENVSVGVQRLDGSGLEIVSYSTTAIKKAIGEAKSLAKHLVPE